MQTSRLALPQRLRAPGVLGGARGRRLVVWRAASGKAQQSVAAAEEPAEESVFVDPFIRSLLLGVSAGAVCELAHVAFKGVQLLETSSLQALPSFIDQFSPLMVWDHVAALGFWALLYVIEVAAILSVFQASSDETQAVNQIRGMTSLSQRMLPIRLGVFKRALYLLATGRLSPSPAVAAAVAEASTSTSAAPNPAADRLQFTDTAVADVIADIQAQAAAPTRAPALPDYPAAKPRPGSPSPKDKQQQWPAGSLKERRQHQGLRPGQWDPAAAKPLIDRREQELLERKSYLKNFWYAAALSEQLVPGKPLGVDILGSRVTLFRDGDKVVCLDDTCPHRGAPLSQGWITNNEHTGGHTCVVCPYHGWAIDGAGRLQDVPSAEPGKWPKRPIVSSYPVEERGGFVWLFWGDKALPADERPPIPFAPELEDPAWHAVYGEIEFDCGHWGVFENAIDMAHIHYLHNDSFGNSEKPRIHDMATTRDTFHVEAQFSIHNKPVSKLWEWTAVESVPVTAKAMLPSSSAITIQLGAGVSMITFVNTVPISANRSVNRFALIRNFAGWEGFDRWARNAMFKILGEDKVMVEKLTPERLAAEFSLGPDAPQIAFRKLRQEWVDMGYAVAPESVAPRRGLAPDM